MNTLVPPRRRQGSFPLHPVRETSTTAARALGSPQIASVVCPFVMLAGDMLLSARW